MSRAKVGKAFIIAFAVYCAAMPYNIPLERFVPNALIRIPIWIFPIILSIAWLAEGTKADRIQIRRTNICLTPSGALIPFAIAMLLGFQLEYLMPFAIGVAMMAGFMFKFSKPDLLRGNVRFKLGYALMFSYGIAAFAALIMKGTTDVAFNIQFLAPLAGAVGMVGILLGNIATGLELLSQASTPATFKQKIILGSNGVRDVLWAPLFVAILLFTVPELYWKLQTLLPLIPR
jgi:hypothetical protein